MGCQDVIGDSLRAGALTAPHALANHQPRPKPAQRLHDAHGRQPRRAGVGGAGDVVNFEVETAEGAGGFDLVHVAFDSRVGDHAHDGAVEAQPRQADGGGGIPALSGKRNAASRALPLNNSRGDSSASASSGGSSERGGLRVVCVTCSSPPMAAAASASSARWSPRPPRAARRRPARASATRAPAQRRPARER